MKKILIVDDSPTIRRMVHASLVSMEEVSFDEATNGLEAIELLSRGPFNVMILDLNMPDMHGLEVLKFVRAHNAYRDIPVIVLTTKYDEETRKAALNAGATDYLTKPFQPPVLLEHVARLINPK